MPLINEASLESMESVNISEQQYIYNPIQERHTKFPTQPSEVLLKN